MGDRSDDIFDSSFYNFPEDFTDSTTSPAIQTDDYIIAKRRYFWGKDVTRANDQFRRIIDYAFTAGYKAGRIDAMREISEIEKEKNGRQ